MADEGDKLVFAVGCDAAILGITTRDDVEIVVYDTAKIVQILRRRDGMSLAEAEEFFEFNVLGAWVGERTPLFLRLIR
jgi:hypothetical protein